MGEAWKRLDLGGGGLQSANVRLAKLLNKRLRMQVYLGQTRGPPPRGFRGRFAEGGPNEYPPIKELEQPAHRRQRDAGRARRSPNRSGYCANWRRHARNGTGSESRARGA